MSLLGKQGVTRKNLHLNEMTKGRLVFQKHKQVKCIRETGQKAKDTACMTVNLLESWQRNKGGYV